MTHDAPAYGLWLLVAMNSLVFIIFAFSFGKPQSPRDWRSFGAFIVALFSEMYGFPLSIYLLSVTRNMSASSSSCSASCSSGQPS